MIPKRIPLNLDVLRLGRHPLQSLSTFHRAVKKLSHFEIKNLLIDFWLVLTNFTYILPITVPDRNIQISLIWMKKSANPFRIRKYPSEGIGNAGQIDKKKFFGKNPQLGNAYSGTPFNISLFIIFRFSIPTLWSKNCCFSFNPKFHFTNTKTRVVVRVTLPLTNSLKIVFCLQI